VSWRSGEETARDLGRLSAAFARLHTDLGEVALTLATPAATVLLAECALLHSWHGELLFDRLPFRAGFDRHSVCDPGDFVVDFEGREEAAVLAGYGDLLARLIQEVTQLGRNSSAAAERAVARAARLILSDLSTIHAELSQL